MKIHPHVVPNLFEFLKAPVTSIVWRRRKKKYYASQWGPSTVWLETFFKISYFLFTRKMKFIQGWNNLRE